jgi:hypothetical protein
LLVAGTVLLLHFDIAAVAAVDNCQLFYAIELVGLGEALFFDWIEPLHLLLIDLMPLERF